MELLLELPGIIWKIIPFLELHDFFSGVLPLGKMNKLIPHFRLLFVNGFVDI
jgi:hypothetical protein